MAGPSDEFAGAPTTVFEMLHYGDDFVPIDDRYQQTFQMDERRESRTQELSRHGSFLPAMAAYHQLSPDGISSLLEAADREALLSASRYAAGLDMEPLDDDDDERFVPPVPRLPRARRDPFHYSRTGLGGAYRDGGVPPAPAAAAKKLEMRRYGGSRDGTSADSTGCVICIQDYEVGDELTVVPCSGGHRFHQKCLAVWLARKRLCPLCRHPLPAEVQVQHGIN